MKRGPRRHLKFAVLATDCALFSIRDGEVLVRLIEVHRPPHFTHCAGLPGGLLHPEETAEVAAVRHVAQKTGIAPSKLYMEQLYTFSKIHRDPRGRVVAVAYLGLVPWGALSSREQQHAKGTWWAPLKKARRLAYDHDEILRKALQRLQSRVTYSTIISKLMPVEFTLTELEQAYESILGTDLDKRNFRKKLSKLGIVSPVGRKRREGRARPAELYRFTSSAVDHLEII